MKLRCICTTEREFRPDPVNTGESASWLDDLRDDFANKNPAEHSAGQTTILFIHPTFSAQDRLPSRFSICLTQQTNQFQEVDITRVVSANYGRHRSLSSCVSIDENRGERGYFLFVRRHLTGESERDVFCRYFLLHSSNACSYFGAGIGTLFALCFCIMIGSYLELGVWNWVTHWSSIVVFRISAGYEFGQ